MDACLTPEFKFVREMGISHAEFFRSLSSALIGEEFTVSDRGARVSYAGGIIELTLSEERIRKLGSLGLPRTMVEFKFSGLSQQQADRFMDRFELHFRRGGG
ncbi:MAG: hypothetical protein OEU36_03090 [Gammaproteobacteria bacterium]|nr:hypothetical protein [Gammaproteobacteria bacterium]